MTAVSRAITIEQGATYDRLNFLMCTNTGTPTAPVQGPPIDLTGCTARMQIRAKVSVKETSPALVTATTENGGIAIDGPNGRIAVTLSPAMTDALEITRGLYDLELVWPSGRVDRVLSGPVTVSLGVTQDSA